jgi:hypothetical protein
MLPMRPKSQQEHSRGRCSQFKSDHSGLMKLDSIFNQDGYLQVIFIKP